MQRVKHEAQDCQQKFDCSAQESSCLHEVILKTCQAPEMKGMRPNDKLFVVFPAGDNFTGPISDCKEAEAMNLICKTLAPGRFDAQC